MGRTPTEMLPLPKTWSVVAWLGWTLQVAEACVNGLDYAIAWTLAKAIIALLWLGAGAFVLWFGYLLFLRPFLLVVSWAAQTQR